MKPVSFILFFTLLLKISFSQERHSILIIDQIEKNNIDSIYKYFDPVYLKMSKQKNKRTLQGFHSDFLLLSLTAKRSIYPYWRTGDNVFSFRYFDSTGMVLQIELSYKDGDINPKIYLVETLGSGTIKKLRDAALIDPIIVASQEQSVENLKKQRIDNPQFLQSIELVKTYGLDVNQHLIDRLYRNLNLYQKPNELPDYPIWLVLRELGNNIYISDAKTYEPLSSDISTIILEDYFFESKDNTISNILREIKRISKNNFACTILQENEWDKAKENFVTIHFKVFEKEFKLTHNEDLGTGTLSDRFFTDLLIPALQGSITKGRLLYTLDDNSINFIYFKDENHFSKFKKEFNRNNFYKEVK